MAELESRAGFGGQQFKKSLEPAGVLLHVRRKLKQNHTETLFQQRRCFQKVFRFIRDVVQTLDVRDALRRLDREAKAGRHLGLPVFDHARLRQAIESVVDFDRWQTAREIRKHLFRRQIFGIEVALPFFVAVAAGADVKVHSCKPGVSVYSESDGTSAQAWAEMFFSFPYSKR